MDIIQEFTEWRKTHQFSLREASRQIGVSSGALSEIERGRRKTPPHAIVKMVKTVEVWSGFSKQSGQSPRNRGADERI